MNNIVLICTAVIAANLTFYVNERLKQGPVRSSAGLSLLVACFFTVFPHILSPALVKNIPVVFIGGSFIGMVSAKLLSGYLRLSMAALVFSIIYLNTSKFFNGYGGALGTAASISVLVVLSLPFLNIKGKLTSGFQQIKKMIFSRR
ncbi:hypothetical protein D0C36_16815 [Mucilaginibacter conchicola]|uniref:Uncharacterized protein n=1 Tax=Mucilaginibacter conchicola TaxID=2303333 RepID=A0A372NRT5_9SPHI|nr:hypothetical protein D0C36_16815 [Mucilaginibacter conchicola]